MAFIMDHQLSILIICFVAGAIGAVYLFKKPAGHSYWKAADLIWVVLGGFGALVTVFAGLYQADNSQINRQIDVAYVASTTFDRDAARFRLRFCDPVANDKDMRVLCDKVEFLSASTASNSALPLFISIAADAAPRRFNLPLRNGDERQTMREMTRTANEIDINRFLVFEATDENTAVAVASLRQRGLSAGGDFTVLAGAYADLVEKVSLLRDEWLYLQNNAHILVIRIIALCLIGFAAPFRLGKSIVELRAQKP